MTRIPPRRGRNGHGPDCPYPKRPPHICPICRGEMLGAPDPTPGPAPVPLAAAIGHAIVATTVTAEQLAGQSRMVSCPSCFAPVLDDGTPHVCRTYGAVAS